MTDASPKTVQWFRLYHELLRDRKIARAARVCNVDRATVIGVWTGIMCLANESPERGSLFLAPNVPLTADDLPDEIGIDHETCDALLAVFQQLDMISMDDGIICVTHFMTRQYQSDNSAERTREYRERRANLGLPSGPSYDVWQMITRDDSKCIYCGSTDNPCVDHILPLCQNGTDDPGNLACACKKCNSGKAGRTPEQAGYKIISDAAISRYRDYLAHVTVTVTPRDGHSDAAVTDHSRAEHSIAETEYIEIGADAPAPAVSPAEDMPSEKTPPKKREPKSTHTEPTAFQAMWDAIREVCKLKGELMRGQLNKDAKELLAANFTAPQILTWYGPGGWWYKNDFRGQKGSPPSLTQIKATIQQAAENIIIGGNGRGNAPPEPPEDPQFAGSFEDMRNYKLALMEQRRKEQCANDAPVASGV